MRSAPPQARLLGVGVVAPGLTGWPQAQAVLAGERPWDTAAPLTMPPITLLPANERRRTTATIRLALLAAQEAMAQAQGAAVATVAASSGGDSDVIHAICQHLTTPERAVSPTHFHNSVHNAPVSYWSIATGCRLPVTSLSGYDHSFALGLLEAVTLLTEQPRVLLIAYDHPLPAPLGATRPLIAPFAVGLLLGAPPLEGNAPTLAAELRAAGHEETLPPPLEALRLANPAARALPLLHALAHGRDAQITLACGDTCYLHLGLTC